MDNPPLIVTAATATKTKATWKVVKEPIISTSQSTRALKLQPLYKRKQLLRTSPYLNSMFSFLRRNKKKKDGKKDPAPDGDPGGPGGPD